MISRAVKKNILYLQRELQREQESMSVSKVLRQITRSLHNMSTVLYRFLNELGSKVSEKQDTGQKCL